MWLYFGVGEGGNAVSVTQVSRGLTTLQCPYCGGKLVAKKGKLKQHHLAHWQQTCRPVATRSYPQLPLFERFTLHLSGKALQLLQTLWNSAGLHGVPIPFSSDLKPLIQAGILSKNPYACPPGYEFTALGQIPPGALPLPLFASLHEIRLQQKLTELERKATLSQTLTSLNPQQCQADVWLYRASLGHLLQQHLYYLQLQVGSTTLYKIGLTQRSAPQRMKEVKRDVQVHLGKEVTLQCLGFWPHRGHIEGYFKHRYRSYNYPLGPLTEYFQFEPLIAQQVLLELQQLPSTSLMPEQTFLHFSPFLESP